MLKKRLKSFKFAFTGIAILFKSEANARIHLFSMLMVLLIAYFLGVNTTEWCLLILCIVGVLSAEAMNTAIEALTDLVSPAHHPLAAKAKDVAAGAVLIFAIGAAIVGGLIFVPKLLSLY